MLISLRWERARRAPKSVVHYSVGASGVDPEDGGPPIVNVAIAVTRHGGERLVIDASPEEARELGLRLLEAADFRPGPDGKARGGEVPGRRGR